MKLCSARQRNDSNLRESEATATMFYLCESEASAAMFYLCESEATATKRPVGTEINYTLW
ncbi:hypothetical protein FJQ98_02130 [Lysinibacillus agricola]|uniref:Short-chain dehydrogenase n=1 Tax=Lysinibacillus agricola TaxID=2590012 RepID=A0ABX7ATT0_9BACI|nr:hypothetical protein [Lysinibacillus agricola]QQP12907.1 hypothetical protein FJQ98_02130 [Lysinibacillus agricola]